MLRKAFAVAIGVTATVKAAPCDTYAAGGTACVAAHSTTRALYSSYSGALYQVRRNSDNATTDVQTVSAGGVANAAAQDQFCARTTCLISIIYDQSGRANHLTQAPPGGAASGPNPGGFDDLAGAVGAPVFLDGQKAYGVWIHPSAGYRNNAAVGTAKGDEPQGIYSVFDGNHYNGGCCFDYGNAETNSLDTGNGHMETVYFGTGTGFGVGTGPGPWVLADLENGLYCQDNTGVNSNMPSQTQRFVSAVVKGKPGTWALKSGDAQSGDLTTYWEGGRPSPGYNPMSKEGAIILGIGGDNSNWAQGTFYEGVMTTGYPSDATENEVQANIVAAKYTVAPLSTGPTLPIDSSVSFRVTNSGSETRYLAHNSSIITTAAITAGSQTSTKSQSTFIARRGLADPSQNCYSFESQDTAGSFLRHSGFALLLNPNDGSKLFREDATYCTETGFSGQEEGSASLRSWSFANRYLRRVVDGQQAGGRVWIGRSGGPNAWDAAAGFEEESTWILEKGLA